MKILLFVYILVVLLVAIFGAVGVFHARRYRYPHDKTTLATLLYLALFSVTVVVSFILIAGTDWSG